LAQQPENDSAKAADILTQVNAWRIENGLWPLTTNPTLDALALAQASFIFPNVLNIDDESLYHLDAKLRNPRDRAAAAGWPIYDTNPAHIEVGENAGVGTAKFVMNFWHGSAIHAKAALSGNLPRGGGGSPADERWRLFLPYGISVRVRVCCPSWSILMVNICG